MADSPLAGSETGAQSASLESVPDKDCLSSASLLRVEVNAYVFPSRGVARSAVHRVRSLGGQEPVAVFLSVEAGLLQEFLSCPRFGFGLFLELKHFLLVGFLFFSLQGVP